MRNDDFSRPFGWYDRKNALDQESLSIAIAVVAFVSEKGLRFGDSDGIVHQGLKMADVGGFASGDLEGDRASDGITPTVDFARKTAARATKSLILDPPFAPAA